jgi:hypothetical protein
MQILCSNFIGQPIYLYLTKKKKKKKKKREAAGVCRIDGGLLDGGRSAQ